MMPNPRVTPGANVTQTEAGWRLEIPAGPAGQYRLAQLDDYSILPRSRFPLNAPITLSLRCRISPPSFPPFSPHLTSSRHGIRLGENGEMKGGLPGTWGFGFWNDPFTVSLGLQGTARRLPVLPNAAWFFHASAQNHLSFQNHLPGNGFLAQSFSSPKIPSLLLASGFLAAPLMLSKTFAKWIRAMAGKIIGEDSVSLDVNPTEWHTYRLRWSAAGVEYFVDGAPVFETAVSPQGPLGLVIWIDNQFAAFTPTGKVSAGTLENPLPAWMEIADLEIGDGR